MRSLCRMSMCRSCRKGWAKKAKVNIRLSAIANQVNTAVDYAVQQGYVDPDRLGITGISNGGYRVMCTIVSTPRFKAAIARAALVDVITEAWQFENGSGYWGPMWEEELGTNL